MVQQQRTNTSAVILSYFPCGSKWFNFTKQINILNYLQPFAEVLQNRRSSKLFKFCKIHGKINVLESLSKQPAACYFFKKRLQHSCFLVNFEKLLRTPPDYCFYIYRTYLQYQKNLMLISLSGFSILLR